METDFESAPRKLLQEGGLERKATPDWGWTLWRKKVVRRLVSRVDWGVRVGWGGLIVTVGQQFAFSTCRRAREIQTVSWVFFVLRKCPDLFGLRCALVNAPVINNQKKVNGLSRQIVAWMTAADVRG